MIVIRQAQIDALGANRRREFVDAMCARLRLHFHEHLVATSEAVLRHEVHAAMLRAQYHGLASERDVCRFLNLAVYYGWDFDQRPEHDWMRRYLVDAEAGSPSQRLHRLVRACLARIDYERQWQDAAAPAQEQERPAR
jgi:hypothetical protein